MSPEQARGETVDFRSDQFSLGVVLYEMLTGKRPFAGASVAETLAAIIRDEPEPMTKLDPQLPALLGWIVQRCLSKDPEERYSSTRDLVKELQSLRTHLSEAVSATDVGPVKAPRPRRRVPAWALARQPTLRCRRWPAFRHQVPENRFAPGFARQAVALRSLSMPLLD